ncbi:spectrin alpha chain, non-erythrocytic 1-like isoform X2 [Mercenaria mercenaria]|uniref:spectrin alpha chain, non-erythrocytic 1-like isoform X2 n=1 Tax=Mercenaria mercenaria TaxID=6596 RepID=UPI00234FA4FB|nr:spectrin alpha chain, non-erythrocytic 1-like isoform X2 [Mercenaria mercenaria]
MSSRDVQNFETGRISALRDERVYIQKKTFTKWANAFLEKARLEIHDLFKDLSDGKILMKLLEIISGENLGKPNKGILRVQKAENLNRCLTFLRTKVYFENIGAEDIMDGNPRLILGLIWTIILRFQIQEIEIEVDEDDEGSEKRSAKDALLLWCQRKTAGYPGVNITNFTNSWRNGLGFNALIHAHRPDLIAYEHLDPAEHIPNLNNAFNVADDKLGIHKILDAEDVDVPKPDEKIIVTYVASYYHYFAKMKSEMTGGKRIAKIVGSMLELEKMVDDYESLTTGLLEWIKAKITTLNDRNFPNSLEGIQKELISFKDYRTVEKPPKLREKGNIEATFFNIQARLKANGQKLYSPPEGFLIHDIESAWMLLEKSEHGRETSLRDELIRQERLEQLAQRFRRKAEIRESWLMDMMQILDEKMVCNNAAQAEAAIKKHEAISAEILARKDRYKALNTLAVELVQGNYHQKEAVQKKDEYIRIKWQELLDKLEQRKKTLAGFNNLMAMFREIETIQEELKEVEHKVKVEDCGKHLQATEDYLQQHSLQESQLHSLAKRVRNLNRRSKSYADPNHPEMKVLDQRLDTLNSELEKVNNLSSKRKKNLEVAKAYFQFLQDSEEEERWVLEKIGLVKQTDIGKDLNAACVLLKRHEQIEAEMAGRFPVCEQVCGKGQDLVNTGHRARSEIGSRIKSLMDKWKQLQEMAASRRTKLEDGIEAHQYYADANEAESWMKEKMPLVTSDDYGKDEGSAQTLLSRHNRLEGEIKAFGSEIKRLDELAQLMTKAASEHNISVEKFKPTENGEKSDDEMYEDEVVERPHEIEVEEIQEKEVLQDYVETRKIPQVKAAYTYRGQGMTIEKGEVMTLIQKTNNDWWQIKKSDGVEGFVPANYVKEHDPKVVKKVVQRPVKVPEKVIVKKTVMKKEVVKTKAEKPSTLRRAPSMRSKSNLHFDKENVESRQKNITLTFNKLLKLAQTRRISLEDASKLFKFYRECDEFDIWMKEKEILLTSKESLSDNMDAVRKKFEQLLTNIAANSGRLSDINKLAEDILKRGTSQKDKVRKRQKEINDRWERLNKLKMDKEKNLQGASSIELFQSTCDELVEWIKEKDNVLSATDDLGKDLKANQALQRKHANLERELVPVQEKMNRMEYLAGAVKSSYPEESGYVDKRQKELDKMWKDLMDKAAERKRKLQEQAERLQFDDSAKELSSWAGQTKAKLKNAEIPQNVQTAENLLKEHKDLAEDIDAHKPVFEQVDALGVAVLGKTPNAQDVKDKMKKLNDDKEAIDEMYQKRLKDLQDAYDLQVFNKEADQIDSVTGNHEKFLSRSDLGSDVGDVEALYKRHEDLESTLQAQEEKLKGLNDLADKLIADGHPDKDHIDKRRNEVLARRQKVKDQAAERHNALLGSQAFQEFKRDAAELSQWMKEKHKTATDESYKDLTNLKEKLKKHEAFELELKANNARLNQLNEQGNALVEDEHPATSDIQKTLKDLNTQWKDLYDKSMDKGQKLRQASDQHDLNKALADAQNKLDEMEKSVANPDVGSDLRGVKDLLKKHQGLENDLQTLDDQINTVVSKGQALADAGHFDRVGILKAVDQFRKRFEKLKPEVANRKARLQDSLHFHQFRFDVDDELQWIKERLPAAASTEYGKSLTDAQNLQKKQQKLDLEIQGHLPIIEKVQGRGDKLIEERHINAKPIKDKLQELQVSWDDLLNKAKIRKKNLDLSVQIQRYLSEVNEIENWINDKMSLASSTDYGKDENAADKLLAKNKVLETDIQTYQGIVSGVDRECKRLFKTGCQDPQSLRKAQDNLQEQLNKLKRLAAERTKNLEQSKWMHAYLRESGDFEEWINEQLQNAASEEYGQDYEHLLILRNKFDEFKRTVESNQERFSRCERMAKWLVEDKGPYTKQVLERQEQLGDSWNQLLEQIEARDQKLFGAGEIHRFNRDVEDALTRIQEKYQSIPDDLGRDTNATQSYLKKHEGFENELIALEAQIQVLIDDSARLQQAYPGENADQIEHLQATVVENWGILQDRAAQRKDELMAAADLHRFNSDVRDLISWANEIEREMTAEKPVRDVNSVDLVRTRHEELRAEIDTRQDTFNTVIRTGQDMVENDHYAKDEIQEKVNQVKEAQERLNQTWANRKEYYDQQYDFHIFLRDAQQLDNTCSSQEAYLSSTDFGTAEDQVDMLIRKHEAFENKLTVQEEKLEAIKEHGTQLMAAKHFEAPKVEQTLQGIVSRQAQVRDLSGQRKQNLADSMLYAQFSRDVIEAEGWIDDKLKVAYEDNFKEVSDLQGKMRKLQKHQAFEAEIVANTDRIDKIKQTADEIRSPRDPLGESLVKKRHVASDDIRQTVTRLMSKWNELLKASENRGKGLGEVKDILEFNEQVDKVQDWIREKEALIHAADLGRDYEHCVELQKKANDHESAGITVDEKRIKAINALADKLISQGRTDTSAVNDRSKNMNQKWKDLQGALQGYKQNLAAALEVHSFNRDVDDIDDRINEKSVLLSSEDLGKDLEAVQGLQRKQEEIERDMTALQNQLEKVESLSAKLCKKYPDRAGDISEKQNEALDNWEKLEELADQRKKKLADSYQLQKFLAEARELISWSNDMITKMNSGELGKDVAEALTQLQLHAERKAEIDGRKAHFATIREHGNNLINEKHYASEEIQSMVGQLDKTKIQLSAAWDKRQHLLQQCHELRKFQVEAEQADAWLASKEAFLTNEDLGNSLYSVEALLKNQDRFEKLMEQQVEQVEDVREFAAKLETQDHYAWDEIKERRQAVEDRYTRLKESSSARRTKLGDSKNYQLFLRNLYEVSTWITEKLQIATDESYRDPTNLQAKLQKHQAFEAEVMANRNRVDAVISEGQGLVDEDHYQSEDIKKRMEEVEMSWQALVAASSEKKDKLTDAYQALQFNRIVDDLLTWMDEVENQLMSEDHGKDLSSVKNLLKKHQLLEVDINTHQEKVQDVTDAAQEFKEAKHFLNKELQARAKDVNDRYSSLHEPSNIRRDNLEEALLMYQFYRDVEDELSWIQDKKPIAESTDLGNSLVAVQNLIKKHQALESEIVAHEPLIDAVANAAQHMIKSKHFASAEIEKRLDELHSELQQLKEVSSVRRIKLQDALESQKFYSEVTEAEMWMKEKMPSLTNPDYGKDEESVQVLQKKLDALERDIDNFQNNIGELSALSRTLVDKNHFDTENIKTQQASIENKYSELQDLTSQRRKKLTETRLMFEFYRECEEVSIWITDMGVIAASEDYGQDLEHVEILQQKFDDFQHELTASEDRVTNLHGKAASMIEASHYEKEKIGKRDAEITQMWTELKEVTNARQEALMAAKQVHIYGRDADDTLEWIQEKEGVVSSDDFGHDLESAQALVSKHEVLERDLAAISEQVESITKEAERLISQFPDAQEHIAAKHEEMVQAWNILVEKAAMRKEKLNQAEQLQLYFNDYRELTAWISEMMAVITAMEFPRDLQGAQASMARWKEHRAEVDSRKDAVGRFLQTGQVMIDDKHFLSEEIQAKITDLSTAWKLLLATLEQTRVLCEQNLEAQQLKHEMEQLEGWMSVRDNQTKDKNYGDTITIVEELLRRQQDFEKTVDAQEDKFTAIKRATMLEEGVVDKNKKLREAEEARREKDRLEEMRRKEQAKIMDIHTAEERRREKDMLKAQEILKRQKSGGDESESDEEGRGLDKNAAKNLIGRSSSIKMNKESSAGVRRAISFRTRGESELSQPPPVLQKAKEFRQGEGVVTPPPEDSHEPAPDLPSAPPPEMSRDAKSPLSKKDHMSPPISPKQKHFDHMKSDDKKKRTASFNLRRRTRSFKDKHKLPENLPPAEMEGALERKQELQSGGKKATIRSWKNFYAVLFGQLLCFFKDREGYLEKFAAAPPLNIHQAICEVASDYTKKKHVLRLKLHDGAEFLLEAPSQNEMGEWLGNINKFAAESAMFADMEFNHNEEEEDGEMAPSFDASELEVQRSPSPPGRGRSISPTDGMRVETIPEDGAVSQPPPQASPRGQEPQVSASPRKQEPAAGRSDSFRDQAVNEPATSQEGNDIIKYAVEPRKRPEASPRSSQRPLSEPVLPPGGAPEDHDEKEKKRKSMFSFLKKKKDKEHHEEHEKHRDSKKHKKDK